MITFDRMRVDIGVEFYVRVKPDLESIALAAQTLGERTLQSENLRELVEAKFVDALRGVAAQMTIIDLHEKRADFVQKVQNAVAGDLEQNGLELESVSLTALDQTSSEYLQPEQRLRRGGPDPADRDHPVEDQGAQRDRAGDPDRDRAAQSGRRPALLSRSSRRRTMPSWR